MTSDLKPCPFCGGAAEMDTRQAYANYVTGRHQTGIAIYCVACGVQAMICRGDVPDVEPEQVMEIWNARAALPSTTSSGEAMERRGHYAEIIGDVVGGLVLASVVLLMLGFALGGG